MAWLTLVVAGLFETGFAVALKMSHGMTRLWPTAIFAACALMSFALLTIALRHLEVGPAYAVWTGIGAAGTAVIGMAFLGDTVSTLKLVSISLILAGVVGLNLSGVTPSRRRLRAPPGPPRRAPAVPLPPRSGSAGDGAVTGTMPHRPGQDRLSATSSRSRAATTRTRRGTPERQVMPG